MPAPKKPAPLLSLAEIEAADDLKTETIEVPEWGGSVVVREWTTQETLDFANIDGGEDWRQLVYGMKTPAVDEDGAKKLLAKSGTAVSRVIEAINKINGFKVPGDTAAAETAAEATFPSEPAA